MEFLVLLTEAHCTQRYDEFLCVVCEVGEEGIRLGLAGLARHWAHLKRFPGWLCSRGLFVRGVAGVLPVAGFVVGVCLSSFCWRAEEGFVVGEAVGLVVLVTEEGKESGPGHVHLLATRPA